MKGLFTIMISFFSLAVSAANFPTGTFTCKSNGAVRLVSVTETMLGDVSLPLVELSGQGLTPLKGIATIATVPSGTKYLILPAGAEWNAVVGFSPEGEIQTVIPNRMPYKCEK